MQSFLILTNLTQACFFFFSFLYDMKRKEKKKKTRIRLKCLLVSIISQTMPTQTSALCLFSVCHALFVSPGNTSTHKHSHSFVGSGGKKRRERMEGKGVGGGGVDEGILPS